MKKFFNKNLLRNFWFAYSLISVFIVLYFINNLICSDVEETSNRVFIDENWVITINDEVHEDVNLNSFKIDSLKIGDKISMSRTLPDEWDYTEPALYFFVRHSTLDISIDGVPIYSYGKERLKQHKSLGCGIQFINFSNDYKGKTIQIDMKVTEKDAFTRFDSIYITEWINSYRYIMTENFIPFIVGAFLVIFGIFVVMISIFAIKISKKYFNIIYIATFSMCIGLWTLCYHNILIIFSIPTYSISLLEYMALYIAPLPALGFMSSYVKRLSSNIFNILFRILLIIQWLFTVITISLHTADIVHAASVLKYYHMLLLTYVIFFSFVFAKNIKLNYINKKSYSLGLLLVALTVIYDVAGYNFQRLLGYDGFNLKGMSSIGITLFLAILALDIYYDIAKRMMEENEKELLINHAYTDQLTELNNRRYCAEYMNKLDAEKNTNYSIVVFDLNNLKVVNDKQGHSIGDVLIKKSAAIILDTFKDNSIVGRLGGDEFIAIVNTNDITTLNLLITAFEKNINEYNANNNDFNISIAYGFATSDEASNISTEKTYSLADDRMYKCKNIQKQAI